MPSRRSIPSEGTRRSLARVTLLAATTGAAIAACTADTNLGPADDASASSSSSTGGSGGSGASGGASTSSSGGSAGASQGGSGGGGDGGGGGFCNGEGLPCTSQAECCDPGKCLNDTCQAQCAGFGQACSGADQGNCCSPTLLCDPNLAECIAAPCDSVVEDCDEDGWMAVDGDCCDKPGLCGSEPEKVNPGALEVEGNGLDDNCNGKVDLFDTEDTVSCDDDLISDSTSAMDLARAMGICKLTVENPPELKDKSWGLIDAQLLLADGSPIVDHGSHSIRTGFGSVAPSSTEGDSIIVLSSGIAADATQTAPGPNGGPESGNVSNQHNGGLGTTASIAAPTLLWSVGDWYQLPNPPLKAANGLPDSPGCNASDKSEAQDSVMLVLRMRAPTNAKAFSFNSWFFSAEYPEFVCTQYNDQFIALVDTPSGIPSPIPNPVDKNLLTYSAMGQKWPIGINIAKGTDLFAVCESLAQNPSCWDVDVSATSCSLGAAQLTGTGFEHALSDDCLIGGGTFWLTTAGNVIPGELVELRIAIWDVEDNGFDSTALIDGFKWLANATLPGTN
jgi:hypothetical protein